MTTNGALRAHGEASTFRCHIDDEIRYPCIFFDSLYIPEAEHQ